MSMEEAAAAAVEMEADEGLIDDGADLITRPRLRSRVQESTATTAAATTTTSTIDVTVDTVVEPRKPEMEGNRSQQEIGKAELSVFNEGNGNGGIESNDMIASGKPQNGNSCFNITESEHAQTLHIPQLQEPSAQCTPPNIIEADNQKHLITTEGLRRDRNLKDVNLYNLHHLPSEKSKPSGTSSFESINSELEEHAAGTTLAELRQGITELDVERVIEEQDSHDFYCPNCNSCITRRVILRKRKRKVQGINYDVKREKFETVNLDGSSSQPATHGESSEVAEYVPDGSPTTPVDDHDHDIRPDVFRCLSCFTFFIPTGKGENTQSPEQMPVRTTNWFTSFLESIGRKGTAEQVDVTTHHVEQAAETPRVTEGLPKTVPSQQMECLSNQAVSLPTATDCSKLANGAGTGIEQVEGISCTFWNKKSTFVSNEEVKTDFGEKQDVTMEQISKAFADGKNISDPSSNFITNKESHENEKNKVSAGEFHKDMQNANLVVIQGTELSAAPQSDTTPEIGVTKRTNGDGNNMSVLPPRILSVEELHVNERVQVSGVEFQKDVHQITTTSAQGAVGFAGNQSERGDDVAVRIHGGQETHDAIDSVEPGRAHEWDVLKSIIYGGLIESITSLGVVSSAAASDATTLNIVILGLANLMSGLVIIIHNLKELKNDYHGATGQENLTNDRYQQTLGCRENFRLHAIVAVLSFIIFGLLPPVTYSFSFRKSDDKLYKLITCGATSLVCITLLATGKAHVRRPRSSYVKTVLYYLLIGLTASGLCYAVGLLIKRVLENLGWFESLSAPSTAFLEFKSMRSGWTRASY